MLENWIAGIILLLTGGSTAYVGYLGVRGRIEYAVGAHERAKTTPESWAHAHSIMGKSLVGGGLVISVAAIVLVLQQEILAVVLLGSATVFILFGALWGVSKIESASSGS